MDERLIACKFLALSNKARSLLNKLFQIEDIAKNIIHVDPKKLKPSQMGSPRWYKSYNDSDVYIIKKKKTIVYFAITLFGKYIEYDSDKNIFFLGDTSKDSPDPYRHKGSTILQLSKTQSSNESDLENFRLFIKHIKFQESEIQEFILIKLDSFV